VYSKSKEKFFLTYIPAAPHHPYDGTPPLFGKFKAKGLDDFLPMYLNSLVHMDWVINSILEELEKEELLDDTLVVITGDHGTWLGENDGPIGHGWFLTPELTNVPLIILDPRNTAHRVNYTVGSQVDVMPTILDLLNLPNPSGQLCQGKSLYRVGPQEARRIYLNSMRQYAVIENSHFIFGDRELDEDSADRSVFSITNQGTRTLFVKSARRPDLQISIEEFDEFQENFLRRFDSYCGYAIRSVQAAALRKP
jgi:arylsulfatase A-like enzyme